MSRLWRLVLRRGSGGYGGGSKRLGEKVVMSIKYPIGIIWCESQFRNFSEGLLRV